MRRYRQDPEKLSQVIQKSLDRGSLYFLFQNYHILELWPRVTGPETAARTDAVKFQDGILYVRVDSPVHRDKYRYLLQNWLARYQAELQGPVVEEIKIFVRPSQPAKSESAKPPEPGTGQPPESGTGQPA
jgi:predicted nucleic acid-binding Zn ribbon protein